jgi:hypothetical protein
MSTILSSRAGARRMADYGANLLAAVLSSAAR